METFKRRKEGITLIALVVTIIVLLILAGVSISVLTGENGLLSRATEAKTTSKIAEIEEQANLEYTAMLIDQLSGKTSENVALAAVCGNLQTKYNLPVQLITTDKPTVGRVRFKSTNVTKSNDDGTVGTISIAQGTESTIIEAEAVVTPATGSWYAIVEGKKYKIEIPTGQSKIKIAREESKVDGENKTPPVTYAVTSLDPSDSGITVGQTTGAIKVPSGATGTAVITASAGEGENKKSATCTVTVISKIGSISAIVNNNGKVNVNGKVGITVTPNPSTNVEAVTYSYSIPQANQGIATVNATTGEITGVAVGGPVTVTVTGTGNQSGTEVSTTCQVQVVQSTSEITEGTQTRVTYGKYVNYNVNLGIDGDFDSKDEGTTDDWRVFYDDGTNIYIIAADYVPVTTLASLNSNYTKTETTKKTIKEALNMEDNTTYNVYWSNGTKLSGAAILNEVDSSAAFGANAATGTDMLLTEKKLLSFWRAKSPTMANNNARMTAALMDTETWKGFAEGTMPSGVTGTAYAIGSPTLSMWMESWNTVYPTDKLYYNNVNGTTGYYVGTSSTPTSTYIDGSVMSAKTGYNNTLYYPNKAQKSDCYGYWLASPSASSTGYEMRVFCDGYVNYGGYNRNGCGVRPVVCLPSGIGLKTGTNGNYDITNGKWDN